jgi:hypothetical protein
MLISFSNLVLASQLIVTVADNVPNYKIERKCKVVDVSAFDANASKEMCARRASGKGSLTCLQSQQLVRKLPKD